MLAVGFSNNIKIIDSILGIELYDISITNSIISFYFDSNSNYLLVTDNTKSINIFDCNNNFEKINKFENINSFDSICFEKQKKYFATSNSFPYKYDIKIFHMNNELTFITDISPFTNSYIVMSLCFSFNSNYLASGWSSDDIIIYDTNTFTEIIRFKNHNYAKLLYFSPDDKILASANIYGEINIYDCNNNFELIFTFRNIEEISMLSFSLNSKYLISLYYDNSIIIFDCTNNFKCIISIFDDIKSICFSDDSAFLFGVTNSNKINIYDCNNFKKIKILEPNIDKIKCICFLYQEIVMW